MMKGVDPVQKRKVLVIIDRRQAIKTACKLAKSKDIVLIAGKGHEKYQEINGEKFPFDDLEELKQSLNLNSTTYGSVNLAGRITSMSTTFFSGFLGDKYARRSGTLLGISLFYLKLICLQ